MSRTRKDRRGKKYILGELWLDYNFNKGSIRQKIKSCIDLSNGSFFKKLNRKFDMYGGM